MSLEKLKDNAIKQLDSLTEGQVKEFGLNKKLLKRIILNGSDSNAFDAIEQVERITVKVKG